MQDAHALAIEKTAEISGDAILPASRKLGFFALAAVIFFTVSGGAFGIEPLVGKMGAGWAVALILIVPVLWSLPIALMVAELSSAIPATGGYYVWVRRAMGDFWACQEGWWTICFTAVDMAVYPVLFVNYAAFFVPFLRLREDGTSDWTTFFARWAIAAALILIGLAVNLRGARAVGRNAVSNTAIVLLPFVLLVIFGAATAENMANALAAIKTSFATAPSAGLIAVGLATVLWNYCAWDNVSTFAAEVREPQKNYPRALFVALPVTVLAYLLPVLVCLGATVDAEVWNESAGFPVLARMIAGEWLAILIAAAALFSAWSLFNSQLLYVSRMPFVMARDGWLPTKLAKVSVKNGVPVNALFATCAISIVFAALPFGKLVVIDILLYSAALALEFAALLVLRRREPDLPRPFKIPGGWFALILLTIAPMIFAATVLAATLTDADADLRQIYVVAAALLGGVVLYFARRKRAAKFEI